MGESVGQNNELCTRVDKGDSWHCEGTLIDLYGCKGILAYAGVFQDSTYQGNLVITGGTGDFLGATGYVLDVYDDESGYAIRTIRLA